MLYVIWGISNIVKHYFNFSLKENNVGVKRKRLKVAAPAPAPKKPKVKPLSTPTLIDIDNVSQKLPAGQSMVTVTRNGKPLMQVQTDVQIESHCSLEPILT